MLNRRKKKRGETATLSGQQELEAQKKKDAEGAFSGW